MTTPINVDIWDLIYNNCNEIFSRYENYSPDSDDPDEQKILMNEKKNVVIIETFIAFRMLLICDLCHDFIGVRKSGHSLTSNKKTIWKYSELLQRYATISLCMDVKDFIRRKFNYTDINVLNTFARNNQFWLLAYCTKLILDVENGRRASGTQEFDLDTYVNQPSLFGYIRILPLELVPGTPEFEKEINKKINLSNYVTSDNDAKKISNNLLSHFFKLKLTPTKLFMGCELKNSAQNISSVIFIIKEYLKKMKEDLVSNRNIQGKRKKTQIPFYDNQVLINIDAVGTSTDLLPYFNDLYEIERKKECIDKQLTDDLITDPEKLELYYNISNHFDSSLDSSLLIYLQKILDSKNMHIDQNNIHYIINFNGYIIIDYTITNYSDPIMSINSYFRNVTPSMDPTIFTPSRNHKKCSQFEIQRDITQKLDAMQIQDESLMADTAYKTLGDFSQIIQFCHLYYHGSNRAVKSFITFDESCFNIASILCPNIIGQIYNTKVFSGLAVYVDNDFYNTVNNDLKKFQQLLNAVQTNIISAAMVLLELSTPPPERKTKQIFTKLKGPKYKKPGDTNFGIPFKKNNNLIKQKAKSIGIKLTQKGKKKTNDLLEKQIKLLLKFAKKYNVKLSKNTFKNSIIIQDAIKLGIPLKKNNKNKSVKLLSKEIETLKKFSKRHDIKLNKNTYKNSLKIYNSNK